MFFVSLYCLHGKGLALPGFGEIVEMKNLYRITNKNGVTLCFQVASSEKDAVSTARTYGHTGAMYAEFVREDS